MIKKIHFFNMVEILLALTVIAIGMTSVLGLFPVGLNASREAIAQNCSADVADQMVTYLRVISEINQAQYAKAFYDNGSYDSFSSLADVTITDGKLPTKSGSDNEKNIDDNSLAFLKAYAGKAIDNEGTDKNKLDTGGSINFMRVAPGWAVFKVDGVNNQPRVFFIVQGPNCTENDSGSNVPDADRIQRPVDYSAMARVWKEPVQIKRYDGSAWTLWPDLSGTPTEYQKYQYSGKINVELSWPLELPYKERKTRYYQIVINRPN